MTYTLKSKISEEEGTVVLADVTVDVLDVSSSELAVDDDSIDISSEDLN